MPYFILYLLKVILCSAFLYGYYKLALQNKSFHQWNRFYLLATIVISISLPLIKITVEQTPGNIDTMQMIRLLQVVDADNAHEEGSGTAPAIGYQQVLAFAYLAISVLIAIMIIHALWKVAALIRQHPSRKIEDINIIETEAQGTPFSFFRFIFWNRNIDIESGTGQKIFKHELVHVREKHSADRLFLNIVLIPFWANPIFWLIKRELTVIHEFIADSKAVEDQDTASFAAMIIEAAYPQHRFDISSTFFSSSIKRRLFMLTKMNRRVHYLTRIMALPMIALVFIAFTITTNKTRFLALEQPITVVIDAGHGGEDPGAKGVNGTTEKELNLAIVKKVKELNNNPMLNIVLTRETDIYQPVRDKVTWTMMQEPKAFISVHIGADQNSSKSGIDVYVSRKTGPNETASRTFASLVSAELSNSYTVFPQLKQRTEQGIWVLDAPEINYPAVLIDCGNINNKKDFDFISKPANQEKVARNILNAIEKYALLTNVDNAKSDTIKPPVDPLKGMDAHKALFIINGTESSLEDYYKIVPEDIESITILRKDTKNKYGEKARNGAIEIITRKLKVQQDDKVFVKVEKEASFPGGETAWVKYIKEQLNSNIGELQKDNKSGTCVVQFIVDAEGNLSDITALTMQETKLAEISIEAIKKGPQWVPATQNGHIVKAYRRQPVSFKLAD